MKPLLIFGAGEIAQLARFYFTSDGGREVAAFTVDAAFIAGPTFDGLPVVPFEQAATLYPPDQYDCFVAVSYAGLNALRTAKCAEARARGYALASYHSPRATILTREPLGENTFILEDNTIQPFARIGDHVTLWSGNHIGHHSVIGDGCFITSHVVVSGGVQVGPRCFLGVNATLRDHITLGEQCVVGAGALVLADAPAHSVFRAVGTERSKVPSHRLRHL